MKTVPTDDNYPTAPTEIIQRLLLPKCGDTLDGRYVKIQDGWSCYAKKIDEDGTSHLMLYYSVYFRDLTADQYYSRGLSLQALSLSEDGRTITCGSLLPGFPDETIDVQRTRTVGEPYSRIYAEKPAG